MTVSPVMQRLAAYIAGARKQKLPPAVAEKTKHHVLDTVAAMVSGARLLPGRKAVRYLQIETKLRTLQRYDVAEQIPLVR